MNARDTRQGYNLPEDLLLPRDTSKSMPIMLLRARDAVMSHFRPLLADNGLSEQQWRVMRVLGEVEKLEAHVVAARASVLSPSLTRIVKSLEERGIVIREVCTNDRRRLFLSITPKGVSIISRLTVEGSGAYADIVDRFGRGRLDELFVMLGDLARLGRKENS